MLLKYICKEVILAKIPFMTFVLSQTRMKQKFETAGNAPFEDGKNNTLYHRSSVNFMFLPF